MSAPSAESAPSGSELSLGDGELRGLELVAAPVWVMTADGEDVLWANSAAQTLLAEATEARRQWLLHVAAAVVDGSPEGSAELLRPHPSSGGEEVEIHVRRARSDLRSGAVLLVQAWPRPVAGRRALDYLGETGTAAAIYDAEGSVLWENAASRRAFPSRNGERPSLAERMWDPEMAEQLRADLRLGRRICSEYEMATTKGPRWRLLEARPAEDSATKERVWVVGTFDIHRWKRAELDLRDAKEVAENASQAKSEFLANMSHEVRTPMNGVLGAIELLSSSALDEAQRRLVAMVSRSARTLLAILDDILDLSRIEAGKLRLDEVELRPSEVIQDVVALHEQRAMKRALELEVDIVPDLPATLLGDSVRLSQVLGNLLSNAIKFTEEGRVEVRCRVEEETSSEAVLRVEVADTGCGIDGEAQRRIFQAFEQADGSVTRRYGGTGLGLAISHQLVSLMGGEMGVHSTLGAGSRFWFTVRLRRPPSVAAGEASSEAAPPAAEALTPAAPKRAPPRVLLVEDNPINLEVAVAMLEMLDCEVTSASDGAQALVALAGGSFDLVLMDCQMPVLDGLTATELVRAQETERTPIVALTANAMAGDRERCLEVGMDDFLAKPFTLGELAAIVERWSAGPE